MTALPILTVKTIVETIAQDGPDTKVFTLVDPDHWELPPFLPGAHIDLHLPNRMVRTYSLCNGPDHNGKYVVAVKREVAGRGGSVKLHDDIKVGDTIGVSLPRGGIAVDRNVPRYVFVAGGIGVTPYLSIAAALKQIDHPDFMIHVIARDRTPLESWLAPYIDDERIVVHHTARAGRPDIAALLGDVAPDTIVGCCGPEAMLADFERATAAWPAANVHVERFVPPALAVDPDAKPYTIVLARSRNEITVRAGQTMLSALQETGIDIPASCCGGICGSCKVGWLDGKPAHRDRILSPYERERYLMVCVAGSHSERLTLDL